MDYELRFNGDAGLQLEQTDKGKRVSGYAIVFNSRSHLLFDKKRGEFFEVVKPEAVNRTFDSDTEVWVYDEHDSKRRLGRRNAGTAKFTIDQRGVKVEVDLPDTTVGRDVAAGIEHGDYKGMSFNFGTVKDKWSTENGVRVRELLDIVVPEVSVVGEPAYPDTSVALRSYQEAQKSEAPDNLLTAKLDLMKL